MNQAINEATPIAATIGTTNISGVFNTAPNTCVNAVVGSTVAAAIVLEVVDDVVAVKMSFAFIRSDVDAVDSGLLLMLLMLLILLILLMMLVLDVTVKAFTEDATKNEARMSNIALNFLLRLIIFWFLFFWCQ